MHFVADVKTIFKLMHKFSFNTSVIVDRNDPVNVSEETSNLYFQCSSNCDQVC